MASEGMKGGISILLVEDEFLIAENIKEILELMGHSVVGMAREGREAVRKAESLHPDLVLMDIGLRGEMDGIEAAAVLYERLGIPVVYLTGAADTHTINRAAQSRPFGYLLKPFDEAEIRSAIEVAVARHRAEVELHLREKSLVQYAESLRAQSLLDELTGLYNRRAFMTLSRHQLHSVSRTHRPCVLLFIDLDGLKKVNDGFGHAAGDRLLVDLADVLSHTFRKSDIVARLGGDEFVVLAVESDPPGVETALSRLHAGIREHNEKQHVVHKLVISVGAAIPDSGSPEEIEELLARADEAMYKEKIRARAG